MPFTMHFHSEVLLRWLPAVLCAGLLLLGLAPRGATAQSNPGEPDPPPVPPVDEILRLRADKGVTGTSEVTNWTDQSGNGNDAVTDPLTGPELVANALNGRPVLRFDRANDEGFGPDDTDQINAADAYPQRTISLVFKTGGDVNSRQVIYEEGGSVNGFNVYVNNGSLVAAAWAESNDWGNNGGTQDDRFSISKSVSANTAYVVTFVFDKDASNQLKLFVNGASEGTVSDANINEMPAHVGDIAIGNVEEDTEFNGPTDKTGDGGEGFDGDVAEAILANAAINSAQRQILESVLAERYGIGISDDRFAFGGYPNEVAGIGEASDGTRQTRDTSDVLALTNASPGSGEFGLVGHNGNAKSFITDTDPTDVGTRLDRVWRYDETPGDPAFDLVFDVSGLPSLASGQSYKLIVEDEASGGDGTFQSSSTTVVSGTLSGDTFTVSNPSALTDGDWLTLARTATNGASALTYDPAPLDTLDTELPVTTTATVTGGVTPYSFSISAGSDPGDPQSPTFGTAGSDDVQIDGSSGDITVNSGAPVGKYKATVTVTDDNGESTTFDDVLTITVQQQVSISYTSASQTVVANGDGTIESIQDVTTSTPTIDDGTVSYSISSGDDPLANGLAFNQSTGEISGMPDRKGLIRTVVKVEGSGAALGADSTEVNIAVVGGDGPGGVGDDSSTIADLDASALTGLTDGDAVDSWTDQSFYGNAAKACGPGNTDCSSLDTGFSPSYAGSVSGLNGTPALDFGGVNDNKALTIPDNAQFNQQGAPYVQRSVSMVFQTGSDVSTKQAVYEEGGGLRGFNVYLRDGDLYVGAWNLESGDDETTPWGPHFFSAETDGGATGEGTVSIGSGSAYVVTFTYDYAAGRLEAYVNGTLIGVESGSNVGRLFDHNVANVGGQIDAGYYDDSGEDTSDEAHFFGGEVAEVVAYGVDLTDAQRQLLESALGAKYGIGGTDIGVANARFDFNSGEEFSSGSDVVGVGQLNGTAHDPIVASGSFQFTGTSLAMDGTFATVGHNGNGEVFASDGQIPAANDNDDEGSDDDNVKSRLSRVWRVDLNGGSVTSDITFDVSGLSLGSKQEYVLVIDDNAGIDDGSGGSATVLRPNSPECTNTCTWSSGDLSTPLDDGDYVTLGRTVGEGQAPTTLTYSPTPLAVNDEATTTKTFTPSVDGQPSPTFTIDSETGTNGTSDPSDAGTFTIDGNSGELTVDPTTSDQGVYDVTITASNTSGNFTKTFEVRIFENIESLSYANAVQTVTDGNAIASATASITPSTGSINGETLAYSFERVVDVGGSTQSDLMGTGLSIDGSGTISGTPGNLGTVSAVVKVTGTKGAKGTATAPVKITTVGPDGVAGIGDNTTTLVELVSNTLSGPLTDGQSVSTWSDGSTYGNDATQSGSARPTFKENILIGQPALQFDGTDDVLGLADAAELNTGGEPYLQRAITVVFQTGGDVSSRQVLYEQGGGTRGLNLYINGGTLYAAGWNEEDDLFPSSDADPTTPWEAPSGSGTNDANFVSASTGVSTNTAYVATLVFDYARGEIELLLDGAERASATGTDSGVGRLYNHGGDIGIGGVRQGTKFENGDENDDAVHQFGGDIAAVAHADAPLSTTQRTILHNALAAKYGVSLDTGNGAMDVYAGHTGANGDYDLGVFGIGRESAADRHTEAGRDGLQLKQNTGLNDGDYLVAGHRVAADSISTTDASGVGGLDARMGRTWYTDVDDPGGDLAVDVTFDLSEAGLGNMAQNKGNYVLLERPADASAGTNWGTLAFNTRSISNGDEITFTAVGLNDGQEITLGTTDQVNSPLGGATIVLRGTEGNEGSVNEVNPTGGDAGTALLGPPKSGATFGDLASDTDPQLIEFGLPGPMIYTYDPSTDSWPEVTSSSTSMTSGEGFALFVFDDEGSPDADPVDPTLPITVEGGSSVNSDVTRNPSNEYKWVFLANPFAAPFNVGSITAGGNIDDYSNIAQVWNADLNMGDGGWTTIDRTNDPTVGVGQAFFLECTVAASNACPTSVTLPSAGQVSGDRTVIGYKSQETDTNTKKRALALDLSMRVTSGGSVVSQDQAASVVLHEKATADWERFDATKLAPFLSEYAALAPMSPAGDSLKRAAQAGLPWPESDTVEVPLDTTVVGDISGTATLQLADAENLNSDWTVEVVDTKGTSDPSDDVIQSLSVGGNGYQFSISEPKSAKSDSKDASEKTAQSSSSASTSKESRKAPSPGALTLTDRLHEQRKNGGTRRSKVDASTSPPTGLKLRIIRPTSSPSVQIAEFAAQPEEERAVVTWKTASELKNEGFYVEHQKMEDSTVVDDPAKWASMEFVKGGGTTKKAKTYRYETGELDYGRHAFRLRQVGTDGTEKTTKAVKLDRRLKKPFVVEAPYPNPASHTATLPVAVRKTQDVTVRVYDILGRRVQTVRAGELEEQEERKITLEANRLSSGHYFVRVRGDDFSVTERLIVVH